MEKISNIGKRIQESSIPKQKNRVCELSISPTNYDIHKKLIQKFAGSKYQWKPEIKDLWNILFYYFIGSPKVEEFGLDLNKSIALYGKYGVGKSTIFNIIHKWLEFITFNNPNTFRISSTEEVVNTFQKKDWLDSVLLHNCQENVSGVSVPKPIHILINEFAYQYDVKHYGTDVKEYIEMFIMKRYDIFQQHDKLTHVTMNFSMNDLEANFSPRIIDRFREMFNIIELKGKSYRK